MGRKPVLENPKYTALFFEIIKGNTKPQQLKKIKPVRNIIGAVKEHHLECERESKKLSAELKQLKNSKFITKIKWDYSVDYSGILEYAIKEIITSGEKHQHNLLKISYDIPKIINHPDNIKLLKNYFVKLSKTDFFPEEIIGLNEIIKKFVSGLGEMYSKKEPSKKLNDFFKKEKYQYHYNPKKTSKEKEIFLGLCYVWKLTQRDYYEVTAGEVLKNS